MNTNQRFLFALVVLSGVVSLFIVLPFLQFVLGSILIAYVLYPLNQRLEPYFGSRIAPLVTMAGGIIVLFIPTAYITVVLIQDLVAFSEGETGLETGEIEDTIAEYTGQEVDLTGSVSALGEVLLGILFGDIAAAVSFGLWLALGVALTLFVVYYLVRDGDQLVAWLIDVLPMENTVCSRLFHRIDDTTWGVVVGHLFVAALQGVLGGIGLFLAGIPNVVFWTFVMVVLALLPLIGAFLIWGPASAYLFVIGQPELGVGLFLYGLLIVSMVDNYARPIVIDREAQLNPAVILVGVFGGTYAIGVTGLFIGPIVLAVFITTIVAFDDEYTSSSEPATATPESADTTSEPTAVDVDSDSAGDTA